METCHRSGGKYDGTGFGEDLRGEIFSGFFKRKNAEISKKFTDIIGRAHKATELDGRFYQKKCVGQIEFFLCENRLSGQVDRYVCIENRFQEIVFGEYS